MPNLVLRGVGSEVIRENGS